MTDHPTEMSDDERTAARAAMATRYEAASVELERAVAHLRVAAGHERAGEIPRGCAHALAATGHVLAARRYLDEAAVDHAGRARA